MDFPIKILGQSQLSLLYLYVKKEVKSVKLEDYFNDLYKNYNIQFFLNNMNFLVKYDKLILNELTLFLKINHILNFRYSSIFINLF